MKQYETAVERYKASIRLDPRNYLPYNSIGLIMKTLGGTKKRSSGSGRPSR